MSTAILQGETVTGLEHAEAITEVHERNLLALTTRVRAIKAAKADAIADTRALRAVAIPAGDNHPAQVLIHGGGHTMSIADVAHDQIAERIKIDRRYYNRMRTEAAPLLADNINWWFANAPEERLLRMLRPAAYTEKEQAEMASAGAQLRLRGMLGKGYRTIDDADLVEAVLPTLIERGATLQEFSIDERRMHAAFYTVAQDIATIRQNYATQQGVTIAELDASMNITEGRMLNERFLTASMKVGEVIASGVVIRHSEIGFASIGASFVQKILKCRNRMIEESSISIVHRGGKNGSADDDVRFISEGTQLLENAALMARVQDSIAAQFEPAKIASRATAVLVAKSEIVRRPVDQPLFEFVGNMGANLGLTATETESLKAETMMSVGEEGGECKFAFVQGITAVAREMTDYDRRLEFERTGFSLLNDDAAKILELGRSTEKALSKRKN